MMKIGIVSPFMPHDVADLLDTASQKQLADIRGVLATPVTPLARHWHEHGHQLSVFCLDPSVAVPQVLRGERLSIHVIPKRRARHCLLDFYRTECRLLREAIRRENPEVLSAQWTYEHAWAALQSGIPTAVTCHDTPLRYAWITKNWFMIYHLVMAWRVIRNANRLICVSPYVATHIKKYFLPRCPVDVVPNGLPLEVFQNGEKRLRLPASARPEHPFTFCNVGGWSGLKNIPTLLKAFAKVREQEPAAKLALFGRDLGPGQAAEQWARRRNLHDGVAFNGSTSRERIFDFLKTEADMMVHPSLIEAHPMVLIEAMACGVPVIGGRNSGGVAWTLEEGRCGFLCNIRNEAVLAETMIKAMRAPDGNRALVERAWDSVKRRFNLELTVTANEDILKKLSTQSRKITC
jgi:glycosyltransferase involved in cell wall biosynthesis